ncbi:hypothetical protein [Streptomyces sp. NPDC052012]|uniref:hypothetical protein n=1 Tax=Streptomyces sp. NPDC052012 TaxID=3155051 RepID=UPI00344ED0B1
MRHKQINLHRDGEGADLLVPIPQTGLVVSESESGAAHGLLDERVFAQTLRIDADVTVGGVGTPRMVAFWVRK